MKMAAKRRDTVNTDRSEYFGALQDVVGELFDDCPRDYEVRRLDVVMAVEAANLPADLQESAGLLPPGSYTRERLCGQLNSAIVGHAWGQVYGTVE